MKDFKFKFNLFGIIGEIKNFVNGDLPSSNDKESADDKISKALKDYDTKKGKNK